MEVSWQARATLVWFIVNAYMGLGSSPLEVILGVPPIQTMGRVISIKHYLKVLPLGVSREVELLVMRTSCTRTIYWTRFSSELTERWPLRYAFVAQMSKQRYTYFQAVILLTWILNVKLNTSSPCVTAVGPWST